jgi:N-methylhydantoinase B
MATVYFCLKAMVDPNASINGGLYRPIEVIAPEGSIVNPRPPGGVSSRNLTSMILADVMIDALGQAAPDRVMAARGPYQGIILAGSDPVRNRYFVDYENFAAGGGGLGKPAGRTREEIEADVREGKVTAEAAREVYK